MAELKTIAAVLAGALVAGGAFGCGARSACGPCPAGAVCDLDGACGPLAADPELRFTRAVRRWPSDWGGARRDARRQTARTLDELLLGGSARGRVYLAFALPEGDIVQAVLRLAPTPRAPTSGVKTLRVFRATPFEGRWVRGRLRPARLDRRAAARRIQGAEGRPFYLDVTPLVRGDEGAVVFLGVEAADDDAAPWRLASPLAADRGLRPRLDLRVR